MNDEAAFLNQILSNPADDAARLVYADWLDEQGDPISLVKAGFLRAQCELARLPEKDEQRAALREQVRALALQLETSWLAVVSQLLVEKCEIRFEFQCPKQWENLRPTADVKVRSCDACRKPVHYCDTIDEARLHAIRGECVAVDCRPERTPGDLAWKGLQVGGLGLR